MFAAMMPDPMTEEKAAEIIQKNETFEPKHSFAYNLCRYTAGSNGYFTCDQDVQIPKAEYEKTFGSQANQPGGDFGTSVGLYALSGALSPGFFDSFSGWGPGALILSGEMITGLATKPNEEERFIAFVPVKKAKTEQDAMFYVYDAFVKAYRSVYKKYGFTEKNYDGFNSKVGKWNVHGEFLAVTDKDGCGMMEKEVRGKKVQLTRCTFVISQSNDNIEAHKMVLPDWMPGHGQEVWVVTLKVI